VTTGAHKLRGVRNNNPGNIERAPGVRWQGEADDQTSDPRFVVFDHMKWGIRAICRVLITYQDKRQAGDGSRIDSIREIIDRWAPPTENQTDAYVDHVVKLSEVEADETVDVYRWKTMRGLVLGICAHENNGWQPDPADLDAGMLAAGLQVPARDVAVGAQGVTGAIGMISGLAAAAAAAIPAATATYKETSAAVGPLAELADWLPAVFGLAAAGCVFVLLVKNNYLTKMVQ
jgi:hypothetical protein